MCKNCGNVKENQYHQMLIKAIEQFADNNDVFVYNQFQDIEDVVCRKQFIVKFNSLVSDLQIRIPKSVFLESSAESWDLSEINFPAIVKPRVSSIVDYSHDLFIVRDEQALMEVIALNPYLKEDSIIV